MFLPEWNGDLVSWAKRDWSKESCYGKRDGILHGLLVIAHDKQNIVRQTRAFKRGVVHSVNMCPRADFYKPEAAKPGFGRVTHQESALSHIMSFPTIQER